MWEKVTRYKTAGFIIGKQKRKQEASLKYIFINGTGFIVLLV